MRVRITHTLERTIDLDVEAMDESDAVLVGKQIAYAIQPADWDYTWDPIYQEGHVLNA